MINISVQYSGGLLPDIILLTQGGEPGFVFIACYVYYYYHVWCTTLSPVCF